MAKTRTAPASPPPKATRQEATPPPRRYVTPPDDEPEEGHPAEEQEATPPPKAQKPTPKTEVAPIKAQVPAAVEEVDEDLLLADQRAGTDEVQSADRVVPFLKIAQALSPEVDGKDSAYIEDLEPGDIFNSATKEPWGGEDGLVVIPCYYQRRVTEWRPRGAGGGLVKDHGSDQAVIDRAKPNDKGKLILANGHEIVVSGTFFCLLVDTETGGFQEVVVPMSSTQMRKARQWNTMIMGVKLPHPKIKGQVFNPAMFYMSYVLSTVQEQNDQGKWYGWKITPHQPVPEMTGGTALYIAARQFSHLVKEGSVKAAEAPTGSGGGGAGPEDDIPF